MRTDVDVVVGAQAGSEGKGAVCAWLTANRSYNFAVRIGGPNAGHTVVDRHGRRWALRQVPVSAVVSNTPTLIIGAGSEIDPVVLKLEIADLEAAGFRVSERLIVDESATVLNQAHVDAEATITTGTTGKGIGAARAARALRNVELMGDSDWGEIQVQDTQELLRTSARMGRRILIEGTQGHILGTHAGYYPYCTSIDCRAIDFLAMAGLPPIKARVFMVARTFPIRIAGESGPLSKEVTWDELDVEPEITTVTRKVRRIGRWNAAWVQDAITTNRGEGGLVLWLSFADYLWKGLAGVSDTLPLRALGASVEAGIRVIEEELKTVVSILGTGPRSAIVLADRMEALER